MHPISTLYSLKSQCKSHRTIQDSLPLWATTLQPPLPTNKTGNSRTQPPPSSPSLKLTHSPSHEAGIYLPSTHSIYATSQTTSLTNPINISTLSSTTFTLLSSFTNPSLRTPNGATAYNTTHLLFCTFGDLTTPSTLTLYDPAANSASPILSSFYGKNFSSLNDVRIKRDDGSIWFTDDWYGWFEGLRPEPTLPGMVYRFDPSDGSVRAVADGFDQANGLEFSLDYKTLYVGDSGYVHAPNDTNSTRPNTIYAFDVLEDGELGGRRLFAYGARPFVDGVHVDSGGNVWATSGDGVMAWDESGRVLGEVRVGGSVNNFLFVPEGILVLAFTSVWLVGCGVRPRTDDGW